MRCFFKLTLTLFMIVMITGCYEKNQNTFPLEEDEVNQLIDLEVWGMNRGFKGIEPGTPLYNFYAEKLGVGIIHPYVEWDGGFKYLNQLNFRIAAGEMPDVFQPVNGKEYELARNRAILDLTDLLPIYAPNLWNIIPEEVWDTVREADPTGKRRIYFVPAVKPIGTAKGYINKDWLAQLNMQMPANQQEYIEILRSFRDLNANGNGNINDVFPIGGRSGIAGLDHLFHMYDIAMIEGKPDWDIYDGQLTYSAVTPNMKQALAFIAQLYQERLIDPETFMQSESLWIEKIANNKYGSFFSYDGMELSPHYEALPILPAEGFKGYYTVKRLGEPKWVIRNNMDRKKTSAALKLLNNLADQEIWGDLDDLIEGMHHEIIDGTRSLLPPDPNQQNRLFQPYQDFSIVTNQGSLIEENIHKEYRILPGDGMPAHIYDGYPQIRDRTLFSKYAINIIIGEYPIEKFDEFVKQWYDTGGTEVTEKARKWFQSTQDIKETDDNLKNASVRP